MFSLNIHDLEIYVPTVFDDFILCCWPNLFYQVCLCDKCLEKLASPTRRLNTFFRINALESLEDASFITFQKKSGLEFSKARNSFGFDF
jgi:hypothetical protein